MIKELFPEDAAPRRHPAKVAVFMSGQGSNAEALFEYTRQHPECGFAIALIFTDAPQTSRAAELARRFDAPLAELDIKAFYAGHGEEAIALTTPRRKQLREEWTAKVKTLIAPFQIDLIALAGFVPLCNIAADYRCLNVHPGDLTVEVNGKRVYAGLHFAPVERAILAPAGVLRSSVILVQPFNTGDDRDIDAGPVLGVSPLLPVDYRSTSREDLAEIFAARTRSPYRDLLRDIAGSNLERLKIQGDHLIFPRVLEDFVHGRFGLDAAGGLCYRRDRGEAWRGITTVEYRRDDSRRLIQSR